MENKPDHSKEGAITAGKVISLKEAKERIALFKKMYMERPPDKPEYIKANLFSKSRIHQVISQPGCEGIRMYNAVNSEGQDPETGQTGLVRELILIGTDKNNDDLLTTADYPPGGKGCNLLSAIIALPASPQQLMDAVLVADPDPCPNMCGDNNRI